MKKPPKYTPQVPEHQFERHWGSIVAGANFTQIPNALIVYRSMLEISDTQFIVLLILTFFKIGSNEIYPSIETICVMTGKRDSTIREALSKLEKKGLIEKHHRPGISTVYTLDGIRTVLEKCIIHTPPENGRRVPQKIIDLHRQKSGYKEYSPKNSLKKENAHKLDELNNFRSSYGKG